MNKEKVGMAELIRRIGDENIIFQNMDECFISGSRTNRGWNVTFGSAEQIGFDGPKKLGLVIWVDRDKIDQALKSGEENTLVVEVRQLREEIERMNNLEKCTCRPYCELCGNGNPEYEDDGPPWCVECGTEMVYPTRDLHSEMSDQDKKNVCKFCLLESLKNADKQYNEDEKLILEQREEIKRLKAQLEKSCEETQGVNPSGQENTNETI